MKLGGVDDWLKSELRRAERQGLLRGRHLSPVQFSATIVLGFLDGEEKGERHLDELKKAMLATGKYSPHKLFPQTFPEPEESVEDAPDAPLEGNPDYSGVEWKSPSDDMAQFEDIMARVASLQNGRISGDQLADDEGWR